MDPVDAWLADRYQLSSLRWWDVRQAVFGGHAVQDETLRPAVRDLADELLGGMIRSDVSGWARWRLAVAGAFEVLVVVMVFLVEGPSLSWLIAPAGYGVLVLTVAILRPGLLRRRLTRARQLNG
jgi:hypothetical protein